MTIVYLNYIVEPEFYIRVSVKWQIALYGPTNRKSVTIMPSKNGMNCQEFF
jgi:hypothetical protein